MAFVVRGPLCPRWAQGQLRLLSPAAGWKLEGSLPLWVPRPMVFCVGTGARRLSRLSLRGFPGEVLACASGVVSVPEGAAQPASERSSSVLHRRFCPRAQAGLPSAASRLTSRARKHSPCSCLLTAFLFSCLLKYTQSWSPRDWEAGLG